MSEGLSFPGDKNWRELEPNYPVKIFLTVLYSLMLVTGIVGNSVTIRATQALRRNGYLQKNVTDHMVSLACSDLLVLIIGMPVELYSAIWFPFTSVSGNVSCKIYNFLFEACSYATIVNIATLSFERYMAICHPFRYKALSGKRTRGLIAFAWLVSVLVALPLLVATGTQGFIPQRESAPVQNLTFCTNLREHWVMYRCSIFSAFVLYVAVLVCVAFMCRAMILVLRTPMASSAGDANGTQRGPKHESSRARMARKQTIIFLGLIVASLMLCWLPMQIRRVMMAALPKSSWDSAFFRSYVALQPVADTFFYLSSVVNPFLYNVSSRQFREVFVQVLRCRLTIEHVNRRTIPKAPRLSSRSLRPLLRSLRRSKERQDGDQDGTAPKVEDDSGIASLGKAEESTVVLKTVDVPSESEV